MALLLGIVSGLYEGRLPVESERIGNGTSAHRTAPVVEDDASTRQGIVDALQFVGYATLEAATSDEKGAPAP